MAWIETESLSFVARHEAEDTDCAQRTLDALEDLRLRLEERFDEAPGEITVIVHPTPGWLAAAHPFLPAARLAAAPAGRRYLAGWAMASELHVLNDHYLDARGAGDDSTAALRGTAERLYVQVVVGANNDRLPPPWGPRRFMPVPRWTWLIEGAAQYYSGQVPLFRAAVSTRLRERKAAGLPAVCSRRDHPRRNRLRPARARAGPGRLRRARRRACAATGPERPSSSPSGRATARSSESGAPTCAGSASAGSTTSWAAWSSQRALRAQLGASRPAGRRSRRSSRGTQRPLGPIARPA